MFGKRKSEIDYPDTWGTHEEEEDVPPYSYTCTVCGCLIDPARTQKVLREEATNGRWEDYYCARDLRPYDRVVIVCAHETHYYQRGYSHDSYPFPLGTKLSHWESSLWPLWVEVTEAGKPLKVKKT